MAIISRQELAADHEIERCIRSNQLWSTYVEERWSRSERQMGRYECVQVVATPSASTWNVCRYSRDEEPHSVTIPAVGSGVPTCTCPAFASSWLPCPAICAVFCRLERELRDVVNLHVRWHLQTHPRFEQVLSRMRLAVPTMVCDRARDCAGDGLRSQAALLSFEDYHKIKVPKGPSKRYSALLDVATAVASEASKMADDQVYRTTLAALTTLLNQVRSSCAGTAPTQRAVDLACAVMPPKKSGRAVGRPRAYKNVSRLALGQK